MSDAPRDPIEVLREAARVDPPSPFATARAARALDAAIDADVRRRLATRWTSARVAGVALIAAASAGALAFAVAQRAGPASSSAFAPPGVAAGAPAPPPPTWSMTVTAALDDVAGGDGPSLEPAPSARIDAPAPARRARRGSDAGPGTAGSTSADAVGEARALLARADATGLALLARRHPDALTAVDDELARDRRADVMRLRCQHLLLHARDVRAMEACRAFGQEHPQDPAARVLSFAAGRLAEDRGDLAWAEEEYSRALLLSPFSGLSGTDALLARARVRHAAGDVEEARADLRLYLHSEPAARSDEAVASLAIALGL